MASLTVDRPMVSMEFHKSSLMISASLNFHMASEKVMGICLRMLLATTLAARSSYSVWMVDIPTAVSATRASISVDWIPSYKLSMTF